MSYQLMAWASEQRTGSATRKAVLMALTNAANHQTGRCDPSIEAIACETELGERTVRRALTDLCEAGLIARARKVRDDGWRGGYRYSFPHMASVADRPARDAGGGDDHARKRRAVRGAGQEPGVDLSQELTPEPGPPHSPPLSVDRRPVTAEERDLADLVLGEWNALTRQTLRSPDWLKKIIMRIREHPELGLNEHVHIIRVALANPWWKGEPGPQVVYGNGALFEQQLMQAANGNVGGSQGAFEVALRVLREEGSKT